MRAALGYTALSAAVSLLCALNVHAYDIKGISPGDSLEKVKSAFKGIECKESEAEWRCAYRPPVRYTGRETSVDALQSFAGFIPTRWSISGRNGSVDSIRVSVEFHFAEILAALTEKFGAPTERNDTIVKQSLGREFHQVQVTWSDATSKLTIANWASLPDETNVSLVSKASIERDKQMRVERAKKAAGDL